ncbi:hypothetical protein RDI58_022066 [Solanum bulbocastanum]|uniref:PPIase cyclophilin-type domain-containing protein n=1 Tax=Solanum bulbocastanum TaxID=147425 RepID=A0AAN8T7C3_SOLBU
MIDDDVRLDDDWMPKDEELGVREEKEAHSRAVILESVGDIPDAEMKSERRQQAAWLLKISEKKKRDKKATSANNKATFQAAQEAVARDFPSTEHIRAVSHSTGIVLNILLTPWSLKCSVFDNVITTSPKVENKKKALASEQAHARRCRIKGCNAQNTSCEVLRQAYQSVSFDVQVFLKLCKINYYDGYLWKYSFGDPTGSGDDEIHLDLEHSKSGIVAMAEKNLNATQLYITHLDYLDTVFGENGEGFDSLNKIFNEAYLDEISESNTLTYWSILAN